MKVLNYRELLKTPHGTIFKCVSPNKTILSEDVWVKINPPINGDNVCWDFAVIKLICEPRAADIADEMIRAWNGEEDKVFDAERSIDEIPHIHLNNPIHYIESIVADELKSKIFCIMDLRETAVHPRGYHEAVFIGATVL